MLNNYLNEKNERIRSYNMKSSLKEGDPTDTESNFSTNANDEYQNVERQIKVLDRFNVILSIFAERANSEMSQLQIEFAYLRYVKSRLARGGHANYGNIYQEFKGNFFVDHAADFEVVSGKQSTVRGSVGGSGETQLELEKRKIHMREGQIKEILAKLAERRKIERGYRRENSTSTPTIALVGYTNAGKTALLNSMAGTSLESENKLFQTLTTIIKRYYKYNHRVNLPNNQHALLLDTVGFITNLPHELVESFKSTLEEIFYTDILIHVIDASNPLFTYQRETVYRVLDEIYPKSADYKKKLVHIL
jgi:GTP-binding protein HflX